MSFADSSFDVVIDKGTYDALACGDSKEQTKALFTEMLRVTKNSLLIITNGTPEKRMPDFKEYAGNCEISYAKI